MEKNYIKNRVYYIRMAHKISARNLSLELGMSTEYINQLESGRLVPSLDFLINFCEYFGMTLGEFFDEGTAYPLETKKIVEELNKMTSEEIDLIYNLLLTINNKK